MFKKMCLAIAATIAMSACSAPRNESADSATTGAAAGQIAAPDSLKTRTTDSVRADSASRNANDTSRIGRDTGRQSQAPTPNKQP